jgi:protein dithiol oxidoreductase (disulfide-forming)
MKSVFTCLIFMAALLTGCGSESAPPASPTPAVATAPAAAEPASTTPAPETDSAAGAPTEAAPVDTAASAAPEAAAPTPPPMAATAPAAPSGPEPREGVDYTLIDPPAPFSPSPGKIEVAEVFAYYCIHCANLQTRVTPWKAALPADVEFRYVPMAQGQSEPIARAFYAAEAMGELPRTHEAMFKAVAVEHKVNPASIDALMDFYAELGVDRDALESTMKSFAVNAQIARNQKAVARWAIESTPTFIVNGRYKVNVTADRGHDGVISAVEHLIARERAAAAGTPPAG